MTSQPWFSKLDLIRTRLSHNIYKEVPIIYDAMCRIPPIDPLPRVSPRMIRRLKKSDSKLGVLRRSIIRVKRTSVENYVMNEYDTRTRAHHLATLVWQFTSKGQSEREAFKMSEEILQQHEEDEFNHFRELVAESVRLGSKSSFLTGEKITLYERFSRKIRRNGYEKLPIGEKGMLDSFIMYQLLGWTDAQADKRICNNAWYFYFLQLRNSLFPEIELQVRKKSRADKDQAKRQFISKNDLDPDCFTFSPFYYEDYVEHFNKLLISGPKGWTEQEAVKWCDWMGGAIIPKHNISADNNTVEELNILIEAESSRFFPMIINNGSLRSVLRPLPSTEDVKTILHNNNIMYSHDKSTVSKEFPKGKLKILRCYFLPDLLFPEIKPIIEKKSQETITSMRMDETGGIRSVGAEIRSANLADSISSHVRVGEVQNVKKSMTDMLSNLEQMGIRSKKVPSNDEMIELERVVDDKILHNPVVDSVEVRPYDDVISSAVAMLKEDKPVKLIDDASTNKMRQARDVTLRIAVEYVKQVPESLAMISGVMDRFAELRNDFRSQVALLFPLEQVGLLSYADKIIKSQNNNRLSLVFDNAKKRAESLEVARLEILNRHTRVEPDFNSGTAQGMMHEKRAGLDRLMEANDQYGIGVESGLSKEQLAKLSYLKEMRGYSSTEIEAILVASSGQHLNEDPLPTELGEVQVNIKGKIREARGNLRILAATKAAAADDLFLIFQKMKDARLRYYAFHDAPTVKKMFLPADAAMIMRSGRIALQHQHDDHVRLSTVSLHQETPERLLSSKEEKIVHRYIHSRMATYRKVQAAGKLLGYQNDELVGEGSVFFMDKARKFLYLVAQRLLNPTHGDLIEQIRRGDSSPTVVQALDAALNDEGIFGSISELDSDKHASVMSKTNLGKSDSIKALIAELKDMEKSRRMLDTFKAFKSRMDGDHEPMQKLKKENELIEFISKCSSEEIWNHVNRVITGMQACAELNDVFLSSQLESFNTAHDKNVTEYIHRLRRDVCQGNEPFDLCLFVPPPSQSKPKTVDADPLTAVSSDRSLDALKLFAEGHQPSSQLPAVIDDMNDEDDNEENEEDGDDDEGNIPKGLEGSDLGDLLEQTGELVANFEKKIDYMSQDEDDIVGKHVLHDIETLLAIKRKYVPLSLYDHPVGRRVALQNRRRHEGEWNEEDNFRSIPETDSFHHPKSTSNHFEFRAQQAGLAGQEYREINMKSDRELIIGSFYKDVETARAMMKSKQKELPENYFGEMMDAIVAKGKTIEDLNPYHEKHKLKSGAEEFDEEEEYDGNNDDDKDDASVGSVASNNSSDVVSSRRSGREMSGSISRASSESSDEVSSSRSGREMSGSISRASSESSDEVPDVGDISGLGIALKDSQYDYEDNYDDMMDRSDAGVNPLPTVQFLKERDVQNQANPKKFATRFEETRQAIVGLDISPDQRDRLLDEFSQVEKRIRMTDGAEYMLGHFSDDYQEKQKWVEQSNEEFRADLQRRTPRNVFIEDSLGFDARDEFNASMSKDGDVRNDQNAIEPYHGGDMTSLASGKENAIERIMRGGLEGQSMTDALTTGRLFDAKDPDLSIPPHLRHVLDPFSLKTPVANILLRATELREKYPSTSEKRALEIAVKEHRQSLAGVTEDTDCSVGELHYDDKQANWISSATSMHIPRDTRAIINSMAFGEMYNTGLHELTNMDENGAWTDKTSKPKNLKLKEEKEKVAAEKKKLKNKEKKLLKKAKEESSHEAIMESMPAEHKNYLRKAIDLHKEKEK